MVNMTPAATMLNLGKEKEKRWEGGKKEKKYIVVKYL